MRLELSAALVLAMTVIGCGGDAAQLGAPNSSAAGGVGVLPLAPPVETDGQTVPTSAPAPTSVEPRTPTSATTGTTSSPATTDPPTIPENTAASNATPRCNAPARPLTTASGRRVVLRATTLDEPTPTIIVLHGYSGTPEAIEKFAELTDAANADGVSVMYPEGIPTPFGGFGWSTGAGLFSTSGTDDVEALGEMIDAAIDTGCVDGERVVISGESNGAGMALVALCDERLRPRLSAAVLVIPAVDDGVLAHCPPTKTAPIGMSVVAGKLDETVGYTEGRPPFLAAEQWFQMVASRVNACPPQSPTRIEIDAVVERLDMSECAACTEMFAIADGTHTWPGSSRGTGGLAPGTFALNRRLIALALNPGQGCLV